MLTRTGWNPIWKRWSVSALLLRRASVARAPAVAARVRCGAWPRARPRSRSRFRLASATPHIRHGRANPDVLPGGSRQSRHGPGRPELARAESAHRVSQRDVVQVLLVDATLLLENFGEFRVVDQDQVRLGSLSSQCSRAADVPRPALAAGGRVRIAFPVEAARAAMLERMPCNRRRPDRPSPEAIETGHPQDRVIEWAARQPFAAEWSAGQTDGFVRYQPRTRSAKRCAGCMNGGRGGATGVAEPASQRDRA